MKYSAPVVITRTRAAMWSLVCPGVGEYRLGHRGLGVAFGLTFMLSCVWMLVLAYTLVYGIAEQVKTADPTLQAAPVSAGDAAAIATRLGIAIFREYMNQRAMIHDHLKWPLWAIFVLYAWSVGQAWVLGTRAAGAASGACNDVSAG